MILDGSVSWFPVLNGKDPMLYSIGKLIHAIYRWEKGTWNDDENSILNGPYQIKMITDSRNPNGDPPVAPYERIQKEADLSDAEKKHLEEGFNAMIDILLVIPNDIYNTVDA
uniref:Uncharacterized protein n=1 Tax=Tanacetum cinerariifolium TaxID=118510 RepID=A0A6L2JLX7_TANCI|nr:hypothetical protein [Tanacetum cinerariifolium]